MMQNSLIFDYTFVLAASATATTNVNLPTLDVSHCIALLLEFGVEAAAVAAGDNLECKFQTTTNGSTWNTRMRTNTVAGNATVSATAPEVYRLTMNQVVDLASVEESYEPSGSAGAAEVASGTVVNGPIPGKMRGASGWQPSARISLVKNDSGGSDAAFSGYVKIWALTEV